MLNLKSTKMHVSGVFTFISLDELTSQLVEVYFEMKELRSDQVYKLYLHFDFLDSKAKKLLFRFLSILDSVSNKESMPSLQVHYHYEWGDEDMVELGSLLTEHLSPNRVHLCQVDPSVLRCKRVS